MDTGHWPQEIVVKPREERVTNTSPNPNSEKKTKPHKQQPLNCPRCNSMNTKFCYYNNYSLTQPRYFCKTCRRYWTEGGSLRNIPVGGGSRKNKRSSSSSSNDICSSAKKLPHLINPNNKIFEGQDLNLGFPSTQTTFSQLIQPSVAINEADNKALELLTSRGLSSLISMPVQDQNTVYNSGFCLQDFKPSLNFNLDVLGSGYNSSFQQVQEQRLLFPFEDLKQVQSTSDVDKEQGDSTGYWTGMLAGGGGSW